jgi:hypothetical protein
VLLCHRVVSGDFDRLIANGRHLLAEKGTFQFLILKIRKTVP